MPGSGAFLSWAWSVVLLMIGAALAAHLVRIYVLPLWPYVAGGAVLVIVGYAVATWIRRSRW